MRINCRRIWCLIVNCLYETLKLNRCCPGRIKRRWLKHRVFCRVCRDDDPQWYNPLLRFRALLILSRSFTITSRLRREHWWCHLAWIKVSKPSLICDKVRSHFRTNFLIFYTFDTAFFVMLPFVSNSCIQFSLLHEKSSEGNS